MVTIKTNERVRLEAMQDLAVIEALQSFEGTTVEDLLQHLSEAGVAIERMSLLKSIERITKLCEFLEDDFKKVIELIK